MHWKGENDTFILVMVLDLEGFWVILCDHDKVICHLFLDQLGFVLTQATSPGCGHPLPTPPTRSSLGYKLIRRHH
jgi:hypothetical protein